MKKLILICSVVLVCGLLGANNTYTIGSGTSTTPYAPINGSTNNGWSKMIYLKSELNSAGLYSGNIHGIVFNVAEYNGSKPIDYIINNVNIYI